MEEDRYIRRTWQYLLISIIALIYGLFHGYIAIYANLEIGIYFARTWLIIVVSTVVVLLQVLSFLLFYTQTFKSVSKIKDGTLYWLPCKNTLTAALVCVFMRDYYLIQILVFLLILITDFSCIRMHKVSVRTKAKPDYNIRTELVWPSIYIISISIIYGYFIVIGERCENSFMGMSAVSLPPILLAAYAMVIYFIKDKKKTNMDRPHRFHIFAIILLIVLTIISNFLPLSILKYMNLLFWAIIIAANCAIFEAWAVTYRKKLLADKFNSEPDATIKYGRYVRSCNISIVCFISLFPTVNVLYANINPFYNIIFCLIDMFFFLVWLTMQTNNRWSESKIRIAKVVASFLIMLGLFIVEMMPQTTILDFTKVLEAGKWEQIASLSILAYPASILTWINTIRKAKSKKHVVDEGEEETYSIINNIQNIFRKKMYENTENLPKLLLSSSLLLSVFYFSVIIIAKFYQINTGYQVQLGFYTYTSIVVLILIYKAICFVIDENQAPSQFDKCPNDDND